MQFERALMVHHVGHRARAPLYATAFAFNGFDPEVYASLGDEGCGAWEADAFRSF